MTEEKKKKKIWVLGRIGIVFLALIIIWALGWNSETTTQTTITQQTTNWVTEQSEETVPREYTNALKKAERYSKYQYMSEKWIYKQLTSEYWEWFSTEAANYAIENLKADYNYNALMKWKSYFENQNMSKQNVYKQLTSDYWEWFTAEQAQYAIDHLED